MFENQYNDEMAAEVQRLEAHARAVAAGHPEWENACRICCCRIEESTDGCCPTCLASEKRAV